MSEQIKPNLVLPLKRKWFAKIWNGEKSVEYRQVKPYWTRRIGSWLNTRDVKFVMFQIGYKKDGPRLLVQVSNVDIGNCPYEGWDGVYYRIHFSVVQPYIKVGGVYNPMMSMPRMKGSKGEVTK